MEHTQIIRAADLEEYAKRRDSQAVIPELINLLINRSVSDLTTCRIPYGDAINQPGFDGIVETEKGFSQFVPREKSFWEIGTGTAPRDKATSDFKKRTRALTPQERQEAAYIFVTPYGAGSGGWNEPKQRNWINKRKKFGWKNIKILDAIQIADWLREFPAIGKWLYNKIGLTNNVNGFTTPAEHWGNLQNLSRENDPPFPSKIFLVGRDSACNELVRLFNGKINQLNLAVKSEQDAEDFVAAFIASQPKDKETTYANKCLFIQDSDVWYSFATLKLPHLFVAHPKLDLGSDTGSKLQDEAQKNKHAVVIPVFSTITENVSKNIFPLTNPTAAILENTFTECGYSRERADKLASAGHLSLSALKRHLRGLGENPPYANWSDARVLAQAMLIGRWYGENKQDQAIMATFLEKQYGEWIELVRPALHRSESPLIQYNEYWRIIYREESWIALGALVTNKDLDAFQEVALTVLGENDPKFTLPAEQRFAANIFGKNLLYSRYLRNGISETLALLGSKPQALNSCSQGKAETIALLVVRGLLQDADWVKWASLDYHMPLLAEAAPEEFLNQVEAALHQLSESPFREVFAQEGSGISGQNHMTGLLWALETLAWHTDYLTRVTMILGDLASLDLGGNIMNRPANSLSGIFLPWHPQTCASISKRKAAIETLLREQPIIGWNLILALLPAFHGFTMGTRKPSWRDYLPAEWVDGVPMNEYWDQIKSYSDMAVTVATEDLSKILILIERLPDLPKKALSQILEFLESDIVAKLAEPDRLLLWESLIALSTKHRKYPNAQWVMKSDLISLLEKTMATLEPKSACFINKRLFKVSNFDLYEEVGDYSKKEQNLSLRQQIAVLKILEESNIFGLIDFALTTESPYKVGFALGSLDTTQVDSTLLPEYLNSIDDRIIAFVKGFVNARYWKNKWAWVDSTFNAFWTAEHKLKFMLILPFMKETWLRVEQHLEKDIPLYWEKAIVHPGESAENQIEATEKLLLYNRPKAAISCLYLGIHDTISCPTELVERALLGILLSKEEHNQIDQYEIIELILWLQKNPECNQNTLSKIEWNYLPLLDGRSDGTPKTLEQQLSIDPNFFLEIISTMYPSNKEIMPVKQPTEVEQNIQANANRLLETWSIPPGVVLDGSFNKEACIKWIEDVKKLAEDAGYLDIAMSRVGQVFAYSPEDDDLWINKTVAKILNAKDADKMREGFIRKLYQFRGVHSSSKGKEEHKLAEKYQQQANVLEDQGYSRFATAIRDLALSYEREAKREEGPDEWKMMQGL